MDRLAADLTRVFGGRFTALLAYGPTRAAAFASTITADDLDGLAPLAERWHRDGLATPLLLTPDEFVRSLDAFPLEYDVIVRRHIVIAGTLPFTAERPEDADLRRACEVEAKAFLIHLRQGWLQAGSDHDAQDALLLHSADPLRALLSNVARLQRAPADTDDQLVEFGATTMALDATVLRKVFAYDRGSGGAAHSHHDTAFLTGYLRTAEALWAFVDRWHA